MTLKPNLILASALVLQSVQAGPITSGGGGPTTPQGCGGGSPFSASGLVVDAIFQSPNIWRRITGPLKSIEALPSSSGVPRYKVMTTESLPIKDTGGATIGYRPVACTFLVEVDFKSCLPKIERIDFSQCPTAQSLTGEPETCPSSNPSGCGGG